MDGAAAFLTGAGARLPEVRIHPRGIEYIGAGSQVKCLIDNRFRLPGGRMAGRAGGAFLQHPGRGERARHPVDDVLAVEDGRLFGHFSVLFLCEST